MKHMRRNTRIAIVIVVIAGLFIAGFIIFREDTWWLADGPMDKFYFGAFVPGVEASMEILDQLEDTIGHKLAIINTFLPSSSDFPTQFSERMISHGAIPMITWMPQPRNPELEYGRVLDSVAAGSWDDYIKEWAIAAREFGKPVFIRWGHEFNGYWYPWSIPANDNDPNKFIEAWRHVHDIFTQEGATNVKWVWCPYLRSNPDEAWNDPLLAYPGDDYVDWVGIDEYNWGASVTWSDWLEFEQIFANKVRIFSTHFPTKPIMIAETGSTEENELPSQSKGLWVRNMLDSLKWLKPVKAIVWFNSFKETDWRMESSEESLEAFQEILDDEYFVDGAVGLWTLSEGYNTPGGIWPTTQTKQSMPFYVYGDNGGNFIPSGWMGDYQSLQINEFWTDNPAVGTHSMKIVYDIATSRKVWAGIYWQNPANNWGDADGGFDLSNAEKLVFWARGENGGEIVDFKLGGISGRYPDSAYVTLGSITLSQEWQEYEIDLEGHDLSYISGGFVWVAKEDKNPEGCTLYIDEVRYV